jgi:hypothetical protein
MLRSHSKEHAGLLSWPESFYRSPRGPQKDSQNEIESPAKGSTFSARALQLSMYGSMVCSLSKFDLLFQHICATFLAFSTAPQSFAI